MVLQVLLYSHCQLSRLGLDFVWSKVSGDHASHQGRRKGRSGFNYRSIPTKVLRCDAPSWSKNLDMRASLGCCVDPPSIVGITDHNHGTVNSLKYSRRGIDVKPTFASGILIGFITTSSEDWYVIIQNLNDSVLCLLPVGVEIVRIYDIQGSK